MLSRTPRAALRSTRAWRPRQPVRQLQPRNIRFESTSSGNTSAAAAGGSSGALVGGLAGGVVAVLLGYSYYSFSGAKTAVDSVHSTKAYVENTFKKATASAPEPSEAVKWLKETVQSYTRLIPGASKYVDSAFADIEKVQENHKDEVNQIINETYKELKDATNKGFSMEAAAQAWDVLQETFQKIGKLAGSAGQEIIDNHPDLKEKFGGKFQDLQKMGEQYGPEAKKSVEDTWNQAREVLAGGLSVTTAQKLQQLIQDKTQEMQKFGDQAWQKGLEQAKPLLDKQPQLKEMFEKNKDKLLKGDLGQLWKMVQDATKSGNTDDLQKYVKDQVQKASGSAGGGIEQFLKMIPGGTEIGPKLQQLQELSEKHGQEAEKLIKSAIDDIKSVLSKKVEEGQKLAEQAKSDAKSEAKSGDKSS